MEPMDDFPGAEALLIDRDSIEQTMNGEIAPRVMMVPEINTWIAQLAILCDLLADPQRSRPRADMTPYAPMRYHGPYVAAQNSVVSLVGVWKAPTNAGALERWQAARALAWRLGSWKQVNTPPTGFALRATSVTASILFVGPEFAGLGIEQVQPARFTFGCEINQDTAELATRALGSITAFTSRYVNAVITNAAISPASTAETAGQTQVTALSREYTDKATSARRRTYYTGAAAAAGGFLLGRR